MKTQIAPMSPDTRTFLLAKAIGSFFSIDWRHNGIGVLQGYVQEGVAESRFHIWHPSLILPGMEEGGLYHDHRFDLSSHVMHGVIRHDELEVSEDPDGEFEYAYVTHARKAKEQGGHALGAFHSDPEREGIRRSIKHHPMRIGEGLNYTFPRGAFHGSSIDDLCITYVVKLNQVEERARLLVPFGREYTHAFANTRPRFEWEWLINEAVRVLQEKPS